MQTMSSTSLLLSLIFHFILSFSPSSAQDFPARALVLPITKDQSTGQYLTTILQRTPLKPVKLTVDVGGKALWVACDGPEFSSSTYKPAHCGSLNCLLAKSTHCDGCSGKPRPGCNNRTCTNVVYNTVDWSAQIGDLGTDVLVLQSTDRGRFVRTRTLFSCGSLSLGEKLANGVEGIVGFGRSDISLPSLLSRDLGIRKKFAVCLGSSKGVLFVGGGPYVMLPWIPISNQLTYTPLLVNPHSTVNPDFDYFPDDSWPSMEYFIGVKSISVNGKDVQVNPNLLKFDQKGNGGTKISTVVPYTVLDTSIYNAITKAFTEAMSNVPRVNPVSPFGTCYKASSLRSTRLGPGVPRIELMLENNVTWTMFGANSMVYVNNSKVACLAFVDAGDQVTASIVIGGHQLEDNWLEFDHEWSRLRFSSTLLGRQTTCANFNFTTAS